MPRTHFEKLWMLHRVARLGPAEDLLGVDRVVLHERTGSVALASLAEAGRKVRTPAHVFCVMDHIVDTRPERRADSAIPNGMEFVRALRGGARGAGLRLFDLGDPGQGISHLVSAEQGFVLPGFAAVCPDSHTCTLGALGALAWGVGSSECEHVLATDTLRVARPRSMRVRFEGRLGTGVTAKDMLLHLVGRCGAAGAAGHAVEFAGPAVRQLDMDARFTLCNMAVELSAFTGLIAPDERTFEYVAGRPFAPRGALLQRALAHWRGLASDPGACFEREIVLDAGAVAPTVTWGTSPQHAVAVDGRVPDPRDAAQPETRAAMQRALHYMDLRPGTPLRELAVDAAFLGSCTNSRLDDLRASARVLEGHRVAPGLRAICVPGSSQVKRAAEAEGLDRIFRAAGFEWRDAGCSLCFYAGGEGFAEGSRVISSTNRNFEGRQGPGVRTHLASPATVAASALAGRIADPRA